MGSEGAQTVHPSSLLLVSLEVTLLRFRRVLDETPDRNDRSIPPKGGGWRGWTHREKSLTQLDSDSRVRHMSPKRLSFLSQADSHFKEGPALLYSLPKVSQAWLYSIWRHTPALPDSC